MKLASHIFNTTQDILSTGLSQNDPRLKDIFAKLQAEADSGFMSRPAFTR